MGPTRSTKQITKYHDQPKLKGDAHRSKLHIPQHDPFDFDLEPPPLPPLKMVKINFLFRMCLGI